MPQEFLVIPESAIHHDDKTQAEEVEPPRLFSAAVHPTPSFHNDTPMTDLVPDVGPDSIDGGPRAVEPANQLGTDSPRKFGRSRTDTMVFSEALSMVEELSRSDDNSRSAGGSLLDNSPITETGSLPSGHPWPDPETRTEDLDDEDIGDARSELTLAGSLSPPVEELALISLEDTSSVPAPSEAPPVEPLPQESLSDDPANESSPEKPIQVIDGPGDNASTDGPSTSEVVDPPSEEVNAVASEALTESTQILPNLEEGTAEPVGEPVALSSDEEPEDAETPAESELAPPPQPLLDLNEPPPSEPIPPESESDITDEVGGIDGNEVREDGEAEAVSGE